MDNKKSTKDFYAREAESYYLENIVPGTLDYYEYSVMKGLLGELLPRLTCNLNLLDIGCGTGVYTKFLENWGFNSITGADFSFQMLRRAKAKGLSRLILCDAEHLPVQSESVDLVSSFALLEHTPRPTIVVSEMLRVLKRGGSLICMTPNPTSLALMLYTIKGKTEDEDQYEKFLFPGEFKNLFQETGKIVYRTVYILPPPFLWATLLVFQIVAKKLVHPSLMTLMKFERVILQKVSFINKLGYLQIIYLKNAVKN